MNFGKIFRQIVSAMFIAAILLTANVSHADIKTYEGLGVYYLNDGETTDCGKEKAALLSRAVSADFKYKCTCKRCNVSLAAKNKRSRSYHRYDSWNLKPDESPRIKCFY